MNIMLYLRRGFRYFPHFKYNIIKWNVINEILLAVSQMPKSELFKWKDIQISGEFIDERVVEYFEFFRLILQKSSPELKLLDAGSVLNYQIFMPLLSRIKQVDIFTLAPEKVNAFGKNLIFTYGDLRTMPYEDNSFEIIISLSTLEHVGLDNTKLYSDAIIHQESDPTSVKLAMTELHRVSVPGGKLLLSVPFGKSMRYDWLRIFDEKDLNALVSYASWSGAAKNLV
jgi:SAM-dependent methyltransferase